MQNTLPKSPPVNLTYARNPSVLGRAPQETLAAVNRRCVHHWLHTAAIDRRTGRIAAARQAVSIARGLASFGYRVMP